MERSLIENCKPEIFIKTRRNYTLGLKRNLSVLLGGLWTPFSLLYMNIKEINRIVNENEAYITIRAAIKEKYGGYCPQPYKTTRMPSVMQ